ncbi:vacuolar H+-ATPase E subunit [Planoprotostelium fungivorum]|uniref:Vacuolar H+-ATPase E subunit n=1 Tax=Planoprotostelium fungivorum TaxID=1890364 RepID=A0A2P6NWJ2_9EUKA|nr:vacuolar H+-ATPase E subunit [Planoprotostelium fungivorum]
MEDDEAQKQVEQMTKFILREADEKVDEINAKAQEEFSIEKSKNVQEAKQKISKEFEKKEKNIEVKRKIDASNELNQSRLRILKAKEEGVQRILSVAHKKLGELSKDQNAYKKILKDLLVQALLRLAEETVNVVARKQDLALVESLLTEAAKEYQSKTNKPVNAVLSKTYFLAPGPEQATKEGEFCTGGVVVSSGDGKIICNNTLDARLSMAFEQNLPAIRTTVYGKSLTRKFYD